MKLVLSAIPQMSSSWHDGGLFMGMHWIWWSIWILTIAFLLWAFWRAFSERSETLRRAERQETASEALRKKFVDGEITEEEYARLMQVLRDSTVESP